MRKEYIKRRKDELDREEKDLLVLLDRVRINRLYLQQECEHDNVDEGAEECPDCGKEWNAGLD